MLLFRKNKDVGVTSFILKLINTNCPDIHVRPDDPRVDRRVPLVVVLRIIPIEDGKILLKKGFNAVTKEISNCGLAVVLDEPRGLDEVVLAFRFHGQMVFIRSVAKHLSPMGGGFFQLGFRMKEILPEGDYPELKKVFL